MTTKEIIVPSSSSEIPMHRYQAYAALTDEQMFDFYTLLSTLTGCTYDEAKLIKATDVSRALSALVGALNDTKVPLMQFYHYDGVKYGFEPQLDEITMGMMADVSTNLETPETWHKVLAILYRPVKRESSALGGMYAIEPHNSKGRDYEKRQEIFKDAPASLFISVRAFFLNGSMALERFTQGFLTPIPERLRLKIGQRRK